MNLVLNVGLSDDATCLNSNSPSATATAISISSSTGTSSSSSSTASTSNSAQTTSITKLPIGAYIGLGIGSLVGACILVALGIFLVRKRKDRKPRGSAFYPTQIDSSDHFDDNYGAGLKPTEHPYGSNTNLNLSTAELTAFPPPTPFRLQTPSSLAQAQAHAQAQAAAASRSRYAASSNDEFGLTTLPPGSASGGGKLGLRSDSGSGSGSKRLLVHTDIEEAEAGEDEVEELPPSYREWKKPIPTDRKQEHQLEPPQAGPSHSSQGEGSSSQAL